MSAITFTVLKLPTLPNSVGVLTFDQPGSKANVLTRELWTEFGETLEMVAMRTDLSGLVLVSAKPDIFIAGADLKLLANAPTPNAPEVRAFIEQGLLVLEQLESLPFPTCAAIDGAALGGGLEVALACDQRMIGSNPKAQLGLPEVKLGLIPGWGGTQRLLRIVGFDVAAHLVTTGQSYSSKEWFDYEIQTTQCDEDCLISELVASSWLIDGAALRIVMNDSDLACRRERKRLALATEQRATFAPPSGLTGAAAEAVRVMVEGAALPLYDAIKLETEAFMRLAGSDESKRLIAEFFASRKK